MKNLMIFKSNELGINVRTIKNDDGSISINAEDTARGFGWVDNSKRATSGARLSKVRWSRMNGFIKEVGFSQEVAKDDYIPESLFYLLAMKANNPVATKFQMWLATEVIPQIRKGVEIEKPKSSLDLLELQVKALKEVESKVEKVDKKFDELPLFKVDSKSLTKLANSKMVALLGGKGTNAYKTLNRKAFSDMYKQLHREFGITSIDEIKRKDLEYAKKVICDYTLPFKLKNEVKMLNSQMKFNTEAI